MGGNLLRSFSLFRRRWTSLTINRDIILAGKNRNEFLPNADRKVDSASHATAKLIGSVHNSSE
jgi:hypothetical protein